MKILEFETSSPLFELERDGKKPFITCLWDWNDSRFRALSQNCWNRYKDWAIQITNPDTGESFVRKLIGWEHVKLPPGYVETRWVILYLGKGGLW